MWKSACRALTAACFVLLGTTQTAWADLNGLTPLFAQQDEKTRNYTFQSLVVLILTGAALLVICKPSRRQL
jgi:hypothetical protein